jgi:hypothetical protein
MLSEESINKGIDSLQREGRVDFQWVSGGTGERPYEQMMEEEWHVFHFIGHGGFGHLFPKAPPRSSTSGYRHRDDGKPVKVASIWRLCSRRVQAFG